MFEIGWVLLVDITYGLQGQWVDEIGRYVEDRLELDMGKALSGGRHWQCVSAASHGVTWKTLLNLNKEATKTGSYITGQSLQQWQAVHTDEMRNQHTKKFQVRVNTYLQSWEPKRSSASVGVDLSRMLKIGKTYGLDMEAIAVSREIQNEMPIWYHRKSFAERSLYNHGVEVVDCLRTNHKVMLVRDAVNLGAKMDASRHKPTKRCYPVVIRAISNIIQSELQVREVDAAMMLQGLNNGCGVDDYVGSGASRRVSGVNE
ncbi:hypothetical protein C8R43DRAFT_965383 [Mycena crocata]|nr:hypothetical protein C8R43DRAFT_965383 [Mycena crocata]